MSFKDWLAAHRAPAKDKPADKSEAAPPVDQPPAQPEKTPAEVAPARKA
jgi:hypothetical protein